MKYLVIFALFIIATLPAHAYIDAGSGSYILQMSMAGILALAFTVKLAWQRIKDTVVKLFSGNRTVELHPGK